jgi:hypothetical protein
LGLVESAGVPVYARATGDAGPYLLAGATSQQEAALQARGLEVTTLDSDVGGAKYYLVQLRPGRAQPDWAC